MISSDNPVKAIVFDTNAFGHGLPNMAVVERWAHACTDHDAQLWIPEVVALELAQHVIEKVDQFNAQLVTHNHQRVVWGLDEVDLPGAVTVDDVIELLIDAGAVIVELTATAASEAIRDQVLQRGAGSKKKDVKTGAADSAWVRSVIEYNDDDGTGLIVVTGDSKALEATCDELGIDAPMVVRNLGDLSRALSDDQKPNELDGQLQLWVSENIDDDGASWVRGEADLGGRNWWSVDLGDDHRYEWEQQDSTFELAGPAEIDDVRYDSWSGTVTARVRIPVEVDDQYVRQEPRFGDSLEWETVNYSAEVRGNLLLYWSETDGIEGPGTLSEVEFSDPDPDTATRYELV